MIRVNRQELVTVLESMQYGLSPPNKEESAPQSTCFVFNDGQIFTFNDEIAMRCPSPLGKFNGAVKANLLLSQLKLWSAEFVNFEPKKSRLTFHHKGDHAGVSMEKEILSPVAMKKTPDLKWHKLPEDFCEAIDLVRRSASTIGNANNTNCVHFTDTFIEASDKYQVCRWKMKLGLAKEALILQEGAKALASLGVNEVSETKSWLNFRNPNGIIVSCRLYNDKFPELDKWFEMEGHEVTLPKTLLDNIAKAEDMQKENDKGNRILIRLSKNRTRTKGTSVGGFYYGDKQVEYEGPPLNFYITPKMLTEIIEKHRRVKCDPDRIMANAGKYQYVAVLMRPEELEAEEAEAEQQEE